LVRIFSSSFAPFLDLLFLFWVKLNFVTENVLYSIFSVGEAGAVT
jgi:hypothetical protein